MKKLIGFGIIAVALVLGACSTPPVEPTPTSTTPTGTATPVVTPSASPSATMEDDTLVSGSDYEIGCHLYDTGTQDPEVRILGTGYYWIYVDGELFVDHLTTGESAIIEEAYYGHLITVDKNGKKKDGFNDPDGTTVLNDDGSKASMAEAAVDAAGFCD